MSQHGTSVPLRVLMLASSYPRTDTDWRSRFIKDMLESVASAGNKGDTVAYWGPTGPLAAGIRLAASSDEQRWLDQLTDSGGLAHLLRHRPLDGLLRAAKFLSLVRRACLRERSGYDVFHVNWLQNVLGLPRGPQPALVTVLGSDFGLLRKAGVAHLLRLALRQRRCILAPNAGWMKPRLIALFGDVAEVVPVPFGVSASWYSLTRQSLPGPRRWLVVARVTRAKIGPLFDWGKAVFGGNDELHLLGPLQDQLAIPDWVHYHGPTHPDALRNDWFPNATGLITLSEHDEGRPQILLEAMAAGLPVVASAAPAHRDVIDDGKTGFLVADEPTFRHAMAELADPDTATRIGNAARTWAQTYIGTWNDTGGRYRALYLKLLEQAA